MRRIVLLVASLTLTLSSSVDLVACGDKYLSVGRGARYQRGYVSLHPVRIAVLKGRAITRPFLSRLKIAGHAVTMAENVTELAQLLTAGTYDVVLADYESASAVESVVAAHKSAPMFLPVVETRSVWTQEAKEKYGCALNTASRTKRSNVLAVLDDAVVAREKSKPVTCDVPEM